MHIIIGDIDEQRTQGVVLHFLMNACYRHPMVQHIGGEARRIRRLKSVRWKVVQLNVVPYRTLDQSGHISPPEDIPCLRTFHKYSQINIAVCVRSSVNVRAEDIASGHLYMQGQNPQSLDRTLLYHRVAESHRRTSSVAIYV